MLIKRQRTVQNHAQDFKFVSRGDCATSNGDSLWKLWDAQTLSGPDVHNFRFVRIQYSVAIIIYRTAPSSMTLNDPFPRLQGHAISDAE